MVIMLKVDLSPPLDGMIYVMYKRYSLTSNDHYIVVNKYMRCSCLSFLKMHTFSIDGRQSYVPCERGMSSSITIIEELLSHDPMVHIAHSLDPKYNYYICMG